MRMFGPEPPPPLRVPTSWALLARAALQGDKDAAIHLAEVVWVTSEAQCPPDPNEQDRKNAEAHERALINYEQERARR